MVVSSLARSRRRPFDRVMEVENHLDPSTPSPDGSDTRPSAATAVFVCAPPHASLRPRRRSARARSRTAGARGRRDARSTALPEIWWDKGHLLNPSLETRAPVTRRAPNRRRPVACAASSAVGRSGRRGASFGPKTRTSVAPSGLLVYRQLRPASSFHLLQISTATLLWLATLVVSVRRSRVSRTWTF